MQLVALPLIATHPCAAVVSELNAIVTNRIKLQTDCNGDRFFNFWFFLNG
jgi:hypothetical protein